MRRAAAAVAVLGLAAVGGAGRAAAAGRPAAPGPEAAGTIGTAAGGAGGPGPATGLSLDAGAATVFTKNLGAGGFLQSCGVATAGLDLYIADGSAVRKVSPTDHLTTPAGTVAAAPLPLGDGGPAALTGLEDTCGVAADRSGNLILSDYGTNRIRVVAARTGTFYGQAMTAGDAYTVAGDGVEGLGGSGVPALQTSLHGPMDVTVDAQGNLVLSDSGISYFQRAPYSSVIRVVAASSGSFYHRQMVAGDIYTVAGKRTVQGYAGDGGLAIQAGLGVNIGQVAIDPAGNLLMASTSNAAVRVVAEKTGTFYGRAMTAKDIYTVAGTGTEGFSGDGGPATAAELDRPQGVALDLAGNVVIADSGSDRVRVVAEKTGTFYGRAMTAGDIYTVAGNGTDGFSGDGGPATSAELSHSSPGFLASAVAVDSSGNLVINDGGNQRVRVVAEKTGTFYGRPMTAGDIYTVAGNGTDGSSGDGRPATATQLDFPGDVAAGPAGNLAILTGSGSSQVRVTVAASGTFFGRPMTAGDIYTVAGTVTCGYSGDGGPGTSAELCPSAVALDSAGNVVIDDASNQRIRVLAVKTGTFYHRAMTAGDIYTVAGDGTGGCDNGAPATHVFPYTTLDVDGGGNLVVSCGNVQVEVIAETTGTFYGRAMTAGDGYIVAGDGAGGYSGDGGPALSAGLSVGSATVDAAGNLLIADENHERVRVVAEHTGTFYGLAMTAGDIYTVAGNGKFGFAGDGGPASSARLAFPDGLTVDAAGSIVIGDQDNDRVRVVAEQAGTFYGLAMAAGDIYTVAGNGTCGFAGDGGPASSAELCLNGGPNGPVTGLATDTAGNLLIDDPPNQRVRVVTGGPVAGPETAAGQPSWLGVHMTKPTRQA